MNNSELRAENACLKAQVFNLGQQKIALYMELCESNHQRDTTSRKLGLLKQQIKESIYDSRTAN